MALREEIAQFVDELAGKLHPGEPLNVHIHHVVREAFDVLGMCLNAGANVDDLSNEAVAATQLILGKLKLGAVAKRLANTAVPWVVPPIVESLAAFSGTAKEFTDLNVLPRLDEWIATLTAIRDDLAGKAA